MSDCDWEIVFNDCNIVIRQESDTLFDEVAQEERQVDPYFHNEDVTICILTERGGQCPSERTQASYDQRGSEILSALGSATVEVG